MRDLEPETRRMADLLRRVTDDQLAAVTPCEKFRLSDLIDHIGSLAVAFTAAARKELGPATSQPRPPDAAGLDAGWRTRIPRDLDALAQAWRDPGAWQGMTRVGGFDLPGELAGEAVLGELIIHGWDLARASGQPFDCDQPTLEACQVYVSKMQAMTPDGPFSPAVDVPADALLLDRVIGLSGRNPAWPSPSPA
jgi:uncharacterized protein (TIGR03086 family)